MIIMHYIELYVARQYNLLKIFNIPTFKFVISI